MNIVTEDVYQDKTSSDGTRSSPPTHSSSGLPSPVFDRIFRGFQSIKERFQDQVPSTDTRFRAAVHIDHGNGFISRIKYRGKIHQENNGRIFLAFDFTNIPEDSLSMTDSNCWCRRTSDGVIIKDTVLWDDNRLWYNIVLNKCDVASTA